MYYYKLCLDYIKETLKLLASKNKMIIHLSIKMKINKVDQILYVKLIVFKIYLI